VPDKSAWQIIFRPGPISAKHHGVKTIIAGSRAFTDYETLCHAMRAAGVTVTEVVSGGSSGVDALGERWATEQGLPVKRFPAQWEKYGRAAGPKRNQQMAAYGEALIALWEGGGRSTSKIIREARKRGLRVYVRRIGRRRDEPAPSAGTVR